MHKEILYLPSENPELADSHLFEFDDIANELGLFHFLINGTLLGFVRDGAYPPTDPDVDVGFLGSKEDRIVLHDTLEDHGFHVVKWPCNSWCFKDGVELDVQHNFSHNLTPYLEEVDTITYGGRTFNIPYPVEDFLSAKYGKNWTEKKDWVWMNGWSKHGT